MRARPGQRHLSLDETLLLIPGLTVSNRNNPSQDPRISIRGFGARSAFGVRGIRVLRDGIPLTLPDGQTPVGDVASYHGDDGFFGGMAVGIRVDDPTRSYHVPLLLSSYSLTTYRGS